MTLLNLKIYLTLKNHGWAYSNLKNSQGNPSSGTFQSEEWKEKNIKKR